MCHYDYSGWRQRKMDMTMEWILKTLGHIFDEADKDGLTEDEVCQVKDCWIVLAMLDDFSKKEKSENTGESQNDPSEIVARANGTTLK